MGRIAGRSEDTRRFSVPRILLGAALTAFGSLLMGAFFMAASAWASDDSTASQGLAAMTDPLTAEVSDMSRLAARLVPQNQQGHRPPAAQGEVSGLVSGLEDAVPNDGSQAAPRVPMDGSQAAPGVPMDGLQAAPGLGSLTDETDGAVRTVLPGGSAPLDLDDRSVGDGTAEVVAPLVGTLAQGTASITDDPAVPGVYETVAPATDPVDVLARLMTDGLRLGDVTTPGSVLAADAGQPSITTLLAQLAGRQSAPSAQLASRQLASSAQLASRQLAPQANADFTEVAASLQGATSGRPAADLGCSAAGDGERSPDGSDSEAAHAVPHTAAKPWGNHGASIPDLKVIPGGATGSTAGISVDSGQNAVCVSPSAAGEEVSLSRTVIGELGRPLDRAAELSVAPD